MRLVAAIGTLMLLFWGQICNSHEVIDEDETVHFEVVRGGFTPGNYNWFEGDADKYRGAIQSMLEPLFFVDATTGSLKRWLATDATFENGNLNVTILLNPQAKWSDGTRFTADDVAFSLLFPRNRPNMTAPHVADVQAALRDVEVISPSVVRIGLNAPDPDFIIRHFAASDGTSYPIVPSHIWSQVDSPEAFRNLPPVGTGPFEMVASPDPDYVRWERRSWWGMSAGLEPRPMPHRLIWHPAGTLPERPRQLSGGARDSTGELPHRVVDGLAHATARTTSWRGPQSPPASSGCGYMAYLNPTGTVLDTPEARNALFSLLDRGRLSRQVYAPALTAAESFFPPNPLSHATIAKLGSKSALLPRSQNIEAAIDGLAAVGCTLTRADGGDPVERGSGLLLCPLPDQEEDDPLQAVSIDVFFDDADLGARAIAGELAGSWRGFSIETATRAKTLANLDYGIKAKERGLYVSPMGCSPDEDPLATLRRLMHDPELEVEADAIVDAYLEATAAYPAQPLVFTSRVSPASTYFWLGWPMSTGEHDTWSQRTHLILHNLAKRGM